QPRSLGAARRDGGFAASGGPSDLDRGHRPGHHAFRSHRGGSMNLALALASALIAWQGEPPDKPGGISGVISGSGFTKIKIAIPDPAAGTQLADMAREIGQTIRDDLDYSG